MKAGQDLVLQAQLGNSLRARRSLATFGRAAQLLLRAVLLGVIAMLPPGASHGPVSAHPFSAEFGMESQSGRTLRVPGGGDLQRALNSASPGDTVVLEAGAVYNGTVKLPNKPGDATITVTTSALASLPPEGTRVSPADSKFMPKIVATRGNPSLVAAGGAHNWRFVGIEFSPEPTAAMTYDIVQLGLGEETDANQLPHDIILDRVYVHGGPMQTVRRGVSVNAASLTIENSYISDIKGLGQDTQAIEGWNGPGPIKILNNYLEAAGENIMFGGVRARIQNLVPSDIEVRHNYLFKPLKWRKEDPSYAGAPWTIKNLFELKNAQRVVVDGNVMENNWTMAQNGTAVLFTPRAEYGGMPWDVVQDVRFTHNIIRHTGSAVSFLGIDDTDKSTHNVVRLHRVTFRDNLMLDVSRATWIGRGSLYALLSGPDLVTIDHNTGFADGVVGLGDGAPATNAVFTNNISLGGKYGFIGTGTPEGKPSVEYYCPGAVFKANVFIGGGGGRYPPGNVSVGSPGQVGFTNYNHGDFSLAPTSRFHNAGTDGRDLGADIRALNAAVAGVIEGRPGQPTGGSR